MIVFIKSPIAYKLVPAAELKPGMRCYSPKLAVGWTVREVKLVTVAGIMGVEPRVALKFEDDESFMGYPLTHAFRVIGKHARPGHEHEWAMNFAHDAATNTFTAPNGYACTHYGIAAV